MNKLLLTTFSFLALLAILGVYIFQTNSFATSLSAFSDFVNEVGNAVTNAVAFFADPLASIAEFFQNLWNNIVTLFDDLLQKIKDLFT